MGKDRSVQRRSAWVPFEDLCPPSPRRRRRFLAAASRLLAERGYAALTLENVAAEAGVNKASIRYNFGNKAGLVAAVVDALIHDECLRLAADLRTVNEDDRLHAAMVGIEGMIAGADSFPGFFDILPHAFRDDDLRERMFELYRWWYRQNLEWLGLALDGAANDEHEIAHGTGRAHRGHPQRLSIQAGLDPEHFDLRRPLAALELLLRNSMQQLSQLARQGHDAP